MSKATLLTQALLLLLVLKSAGALALEMQERFTACLNGDKRQCETAFSHYQKECEGGDTVACYFAARLISLEENGKADYQKAALWFEKSCNANVAQSCHALGVLYYHGNGVKQDLKKADTLFAKACHFDDFAACALTETTYQEAKPTKAPTQDPAPNAAPKNQVKPQTAKAKSVLPKVNAAKAAAYLGQNVQLCGKVAQVSVMKRQSFLNFERAYPNQSASVYLPVRYQKTIERSIGDLKALQGKNLCVNGLLSSYRGIAQIMLTHPLQLELPK